MSSSILKASSLPASCKPVVCRHSPFNLLLHLSILMEDWFKHRCKDAEKPLNQLLNTDSTGRSDIEIFPWHKNLKQEKNAHIHTLPHGLTKSYTKYFLWVLKETLWTPGKAIDTCHEWMSTMAKCCWNAERQPEHHKPDGWYTGLQTGW